MVGRAPPDPKKVVVSRGGGPELAALNQEGGRKHGVLERFEKCMYHPCYEL